MSQRGFLSFFVLLVFFVRGGISRGNTPDGWWHGSKATDLDNGNFYDFVDQDQYVVVDFYAPWCVYCYQMMEDYNKLFEEYNGENRRRWDLLITKIDGDKHNEIAVKYHVHSYPTIILFFPKGEKKPVYFNGPRNFDHFNEWIEKNAKPVLEIKRETPEDQEQNGNQGKGEETSQREKEEKQEAPFKAEKLELKAMSQDPEKEKPKRQEPDPQVFIIEGEEGEDSIIVISEKPNEEFEIELNSENTQYIPAKDSSQNAKKEKREARATPEEDSKGDQKKKEESFLLSALDQLDENLQKALDKLSQSAQTKISEVRNYQVISMYEVNQKLDVLEQNLLTSSQFVNNLVGAMEKQATQFANEAIQLKEEIQKQSETLNQKESKSQRGGFFWLRNILTLSIGVLIGSLGVQFYSTFKRLQKGTHSS